MTLRSRSHRWIRMVQHKTSDQYLTSGKVSIRFIQRFMRYRLLKTLTKTSTFCNADADAMVTAIALPVLSFRRANKGVTIICQNVTYLINLSFLPFWCLQVYFYCMSWVYQIFIKFYGAMPLTAFSWTIYHVLWFHVFLFSLLVLEEGCDLCLWCSLEIFSLVS